MLKANGGRLVLKGRLALDFRALKEFRAFLGVLSGLSARVELKGLKDLLVLKGNQGVKVLPAHEEIPGLPGQLCKAQRVRVVRMAPKASVDLLALSLGGCG